MSSHVFCLLKKLFINQQEEVSWKGTLSINWPHPYFLPLDAGSFHGHLCFARCQNSTTSEPTLKACNWVTEVQRILFLEIALHSNKPTASFVNCLMLYHVSQLQVSWIILEPHSKCVFCSSMLLKCYILWVSLPSNGALAISGSSIPILPCIESEYEPSDV